MWTFISTGHLASCGVLRAERTVSCSGHCESSLYLAVGILAVLAGSAEIGIGFVASAFAFSEGVHSLADGGADFYGKRIVRKVKENPSEEREIRKRGSFIIAGLLVLAAVPILWEMWRRFEGVESPSASLMVLAGVVATTINSVRWVWLRLAQRHGPTSTREDLIDHAKTDTWHGMYLFTAGAVLLDHADEWSMNTQLFVDLALSGGVFCYILWRAWSIVKRHEH